MTDKPKKIVYLINGLGAGGAEMMLYRLLERIDRNSLRPEVVILLKLSGPLQGKIESLGIKVHSVGVSSKYDLGAVLRLYRILKDLKPDILQTQLFAADILGRLLGKILKIPVVITSIRNIYYGGFSRYLLFRLTDSCADRTTFVSRAALQRFAALRAVDPAKAVLIHNGLNPDLFHRATGRDEKLALRRELNLPEEGNLILAVGSLTQQKGYGVFLKALRLLKIDHYEYTALIVGSGPLKKEIKKEAAELGLEDRVILLGRSDRVPELMAAADLLVLSSLWEGLPGVVLEAMASELPVVATAVGGTPELVVEEENGYLVAPGEAEELAAALAKVLNLPEDLRVKLGRKGRKKVEELFSLDKMVTSYEKLYADMWKEKQAKGVN